MLKIKIILFLFLIYLIPLFSQVKDSSKSIIAIAEVKNNEVVIRWAPPNYVAWQQGNKSGYKILRTRIDYAGVKSVETKQVGADTIKPMTLNQWKSNFPQDHKYAPIAAQALYGKKFQLNEGDFNLAKVRAATQESELRYSFAVLVADLDADVASGLGLRFVDKDFEQGMQYLYEIIPNNLNMMDTGFVFVDTKKITTIPSAPDLEKNEQEKSVELKWLRETEGISFTAFWIERSDDGTKWIRLNATPYLQANQNPNSPPDKYIYFTDTLITSNYYPHKYRLIGITPFGETSKPSNIIEAMGRDRTAPAPPVFTSIKDVNGKIVLEWKMDNPPNDLVGFMVGKSDSVGGQYNPLTKEKLRPNVRTYTDNFPDPIGENYYIIFAIDTANNVSASYPAYGFLTDSIPPAKPIGLKGKIDTNGIVTLSWPIGKDPDIMGYRVYYANAIEHEFSNLTPYPIRDTMFVDTLNLNTLTKDIFYQVAAVDRNYNHSERSDILKLIKPDIVPPVAPLISNYFVSDTAVVLNYIPSSSPDVAEYKCFRKGDKQKNWKMIKSWKNQKVLSKIFTDKEVVGPNYYNYAFVAVDSAGNVSDFSPSIGVKVYRSIQSFQITGIDAKYDNQTKSISLKWAKPKSDLRYYVIYRKIDNKPLSNFASVDSTKTIYVDNEIILNGQYQYGIKGVYKNGESPISISSKVTVEKK